ncbi:hypothetical protein [Pseudomonas viridiflava]|uniref:hypothetical protein n=1 Tax=Pseudomonas viridiflava TaxID=33069 RepID=UPI002B1DC5D9|nr:hypothetical protein [Pseudomonas viridiflava]
MQKMEIKAVGILWFKNSAQYAEYLAIFDDASVMAPTYAKWKKRGNEVYEAALRSGQEVIKVYASADEFKTWCIAHKKGLNAEGRMNFAAFKAGEKFR